MAQGLGIALAPNLVRNMGAPSVLFVPFKPNENLIDFYVAFLELGSSETVNRFVDTVRKVHI